MASLNFQLVPNTKLSLLLTLLLANFLCSESVLDRGTFLQETNMTLYIHDYFSGPNATTIVVGMPSNDHTTVDNFGIMYCTDNPVTESREPDSEYVGRAQGTFVSSVLDGSNSQVVMSFVFDTEPFQGSTLEIQGAGPQVQKVKEVSVVSGTGQFRYARGYATFETIYYDREANYSVAEWNIVTKHY